ncbi:MAG: DMT family transporter [Rhodobacter sp.]|uniref:aromatic amino acid exporter YddG n=1 Tax=Pararhodobacter sp. TaxID=2127056 RepID=UPI001D7D4B58|nr:DMT family transporter [Pararhodobacter sp.]MCB1345956.1 DMT family transporter [Paracoccaceae bacterium]MCC0074871.1 DMT family transporter [Rhodobacter sp.]HPD90871.1 DMT family transporter [Pararhodobacter sp.]
MTRGKATGIGFSAVALWSLLAVFTVASAPVPPFLLSAMTFAIGGAVGLVWLRATGGTAVLRRVPIKAYAFGTAGLFGYHFLYFTALRLAPPAEAGLICYLWPLLIVLFSGLLPGEVLTRGHIAGALLAFAGAALIVAGGIGGVSGAAGGYAVAFVAALTWAGYSLGSRRLAGVPTAAVAVTCLATAGLSLLAHLVLEQTVWPQGIRGWMAVLALGLGPVGLAFYTWDVGVKRGDIQLLGTASYAAPLLSTLVLVLSGLATASLSLALAAGLIAGGALIAARAGRRITQPRGA